MYILNMDLDKVAEKIYTKTKELKTHPIELNDMKELPFNSYTPKELKYIKTGGNRLVYKKKDNIYKFEIGYENKNKEENHTKKEVQTWKKANKKQKENLAEILDYDKNKYRWVKMPYYDDKYIIDEVNPEKRRKIYSELKENNINYNDGIVKNIYYNEKLIILDYGFRTELL